MNFPFEIVCGMGTCFNNYLADPPVSHNTPGATHASNFKGWEEESEENKD